MLILVRARDKIRKKYDLAVLSENLLSQKRSSQKWIKFMDPQILGHPDISNEVEKDFKSS